MRDRLTPSGLRDEVEHYDIPDGLKVVRGKEVQAVHGGRPWHSAKVWTELAGVAGRICGRN